MVKDEDVFPIGTVVRRRKTGEFALIKNYTFQHEGKGFLNYLGQIENKGDGIYAIYHEDIDLECLPVTEEKLN
jgi:hypothetical protein